MTNPKPSSMISKTLDANLVWEPPVFGSLRPAITPGHGKMLYRLFHITEIGEGKAGAYRLAMANVIAGMDDPRCRTLYILSGTPEGVDLYVGIASSDLGDAPLKDMAATLKASFEGNFLGAKLENIYAGDAAIELIHSAERKLGLITGVPSFNEDENHVGDEDFQSIERLANSMVGETWQLIIVAEPGKDDEVRHTLDRIYDFSTEISELQKQSVQQSENTGFTISDTQGISGSDTYGTNTSDQRGKNEGWSEGAGKSHGTGSGSTDSSRNQGTDSSQGKSGGTSLSKSKGTNESRTTGTSDSKSTGTSGGKSMAYTRERTDKRVEEVQKHISENLIARFQQGRSKGMFRTAMYVCAKEQSTYDRLTRSVLSIFQGNESTMTPLRVEKLDDCFKGLPFNVRRFSQPNTSSRSELMCSIPYQAQQQEITGATWLTTRELSLIAGLPTKELPGLKIRKSVDFALNTATLSTEDGDTLALGHVIQHGRKLENKEVRLPTADLCKHVFITGVTGAGKTTTCMKLLLESGLPFMVIEPAKTEYRALHAERDDIETYVLGREDITAFRLNPFELVSPKENLAGHISTLNATLGAVFPMEAAMPYLVEEAIIKAYTSKGWDIHSGENFAVDDPWAHGSTAWPTFGDMINELGGVITSKGMGLDFEQKYQGSLVGRLTNLTLGTKGRMLNTRHSLDFDQLLDKKVVFELDELKDEQDKALFMGLILTRLAECMKHRHRSNPKFRHLTLVEEAHRLLSRPEPGDPGSKKLGVETFANLLAEVRKYGEGLIIADQIPNKLISDVIKNTHTKIVHRLFSADDRNTIGDAIGLSDEQKDFLPLLQTGETIMYCGGWHAAVRVQIAEQVKTDRDEITEEQIAAKGLCLLWEQRDRLYPSLCDQVAIKNAAMLGYFTNEGVRLLNMFLAVNVDPNAKLAQTASDRIQKIQARYAGRFKQMEMKLQCAAPSLPDLLTRLFVDASGFNTSIKTQALLAEVLPLALKALAESMKNYKEYAGTAKCKSMLYTDHQFKKIASI